MIELTVSNAEARPDGAASLTDAYVLRYLLQQAGAAGSSFVWRQTEEGGYTASAEGVRLNLDMAHSRSGSRVVLSLGDEQDTIEMAEPYPVSLFGGKYATPEDAELAQLLRALFAAVRRQASRNEENLEKRLDARKQTFYRRLLFGPAGRT